MTASVLWYRRPAARWVEALPVGNGRIGTMVFGGVGAERWQLNEDSLWTGGPEDVDNAEALPALAEIRRLCFEGRHVEAQRLCDATQIRKPSTRGDFGSHTTLGELRLTPSDPAELAQAPLDYQRELDLSSGVATTRYRLGSKSYTRRCFASAPDVEMLLQSHAGYVHLLPALPAEWPSGRLSGLCARGGFVIELSWSEGRLRRARLHSTRGSDCEARYQSRVVRLRTSPGESYDLTAELCGSPA